MQVAIWGTALALTAPFLVAVRKIIDYPFLLRAPAEYVERVVMADRLFFVLYGMLATALVVALLWDALSPTRHDHEIVGVLPVHPRTLAARAVHGRDGRGPGLCAGCHHPLGAPVQRGVGRRIRWWGAFRACWSVIWWPTMLGVRVRVPVDAGRFARWSSWPWATPWRPASPSRCRSLTFVLLVQVFFFLPGILPQLLKDLQAGGTTYDRLPPMWFTGLFIWLADGRTVAPGLVLWSAVAVLTSRGWPPPSSASCRPR